jgi:hypothetical protein
MSSFDLPIGHRGPNQGSTRGRRRRATGATAGGIVAFVILMSLMIGRASVADAAGTPYVDGISDQSLSSWDSGFANSYFEGYFASHWIAGGHIKYARYVVQWNVMTEPTKGPNAEGDYHEQFEAWYENASNTLGLTLDVGLTTYSGGLPVSSSEYESRLSELLNAFPKIAVVEAWNEPNDTPGLNGEAAAHFTNSAYSLCEAHHTCTVIAGDFIDSPGLAPYEKEYDGDLRPANPPNWGVHPYYSILERSETPITEFEANMPDKGAGDQIWFTEAGAYNCTDFNGKREAFGEESQADGAYWLTNILMKNIQPAHVFYYEFLYGKHLAPPCTETNPDTALYVPSNDPDAPDRPRAAAAFIFGDKGFPWAYTGAPSSVESRKATLTASVYPGGKESQYYFEYGESTSYGSATSQASTGLRYGRVEAVQVLSGLAAETTYHYRAVATSAEGTTYGEDKTFKTSATAQFAVQATPNPAPAPADNGFSDVSCGSSKSCLAVGGSGGAPLAGTWNGTTWSETETPSVPESAMSSGLVGDSCWSTKGCMALGYLRLSSEGGHAYADLWNGASWTTELVPAPAETEPITQYLQGVSCASSKACMAVGDINARPNEVIPYAAHWNGKTWNSEPAIMPEESKSANLASVSCATTTSCIAVGWWDKGSKAYPLSEEWNGSGWKILAAQAGAERAILKSVSCTAATACTAVGRNEYTSLIERWNGKKWTVEATAGIRNEGLSAVSCASATVCTATGGSEGGAPYVPVAERWDGTTWTAVLTATTGASKQASLYGLACPSVGTCVAAGLFEAELGGPSYTLAETY